MNFVCQFISLSETIFPVSGADLYSMYVGEGEALLRNTFRKACLAAPSIIFFDEADVVAAKRCFSIVYLINAPQL